jgi:excisionase family DNA binding protein
MDEHEVLTAREVAEYLRLHYQTVIDLLERGEIKGIKAGRQWRVTRRAVVEYLEGGQSASPQLAAPAIVSALAV